MAMRPKTIHPLEDEKHREMIVVLDQMRAKALRLESDDAAQALRCRRDLRRLTKKMAELQGLEVGE